MDRKEMVSELFEVVEGSLVEAVTSIHESLFGPISGVEVDREKAIQLFTDSYEMFTDEEFEAFHAHVLAHGHAPPEEGSALRASIEAKAPLYGEFWAANGGRIVDCFKAVP